ncbi:hypothetical protein CFOL_v3_10801 [Cephalotus follicularis]|uniref:Transmembrane protein n=1 Tax=Cephalotus follicularis TaxID=3775 RepID=A0A1Q3BH69_CEPFO|nr:hypothetical protein CFOL_v3_10801 [Cephalotus follicularis]
MQSEKQKAWKINVQARARNFNIKLKVTSIVPSWKLHRFSIMLRLQQFVLKVNTESGTTISMQQRRTLKSKINGVFERFRTRQGKNETLKFPLNRLRQIPCKELICVGCLSIGILASPSKLIFDNDQKDIIVEGSVLFFCLAIWFHRYRTGKASALLVYLMVAILVCSVVSRFGYYVNCDQGYVLKIFLEGMEF